MAVIDKKLIHFTNLATFEQRLDAGDIKDTSIVFIQDAKRIWTHGLYYSSPYTKEEIDKLFVGSNVTLDEYSGNGVAEIISTDTVNEAFGKIEDYLGNLEDFIETNVGERLGSLENTKLDKIIKFTDISASNWVASTEYSDYSYQCDITCLGVTADMYAEVVFAMTEAISGNYAPVCKTENNIVRLYSKVNTLIVIPTIIINK